MIVLLLVLIVFVAIVQYKSTANPFGGIIFDYHCTKLLVEPGEEFEIVTTITNTRRRFVPFIKLDQMFPLELRIKDLAPARVNEIKNYASYTATTYLMPKSRYTRRITATLPRRGCYVFQGANLHGGDFMGLGTELVNYNITREVVAYPGELQSKNIDMVMGSIMGDISVRRFVIEDPILTVGFRDYSGREPMKAISWNHSARVGKLVVRQYDHTIDPAVSVMLDVEDKTKRSNADKKELAFSITRNVCQKLDAQGMKYDFTTNATTADAIARWAYVPESTGSRHFAYIMEGLGRANYHHVGSLRRLSEKFVGKRLYDRFVILITVKDAAETARDIAYIEGSNGGKVFVISVGEFLHESDILSETAV